MMKLGNSVAFALVSCLPLVMVAAVAGATPPKAVCSGCHDVDPAVTVSVELLGCYGSEADYEVNVSDTYEQAEGWAVFENGNNILNALANSGVFSVAAGTPYDVWGVSDSDDSAIGGGKGGSALVEIGPDCGGPTCTDADEDAYYAEAGCGTDVDCNDGNSSINPGATEICNDSVDNDCNGLIDNQDPICGTVTCTDADGDGFSIEGGDCGPVDCTDSNPDIYPGATDICNDGIDQDCSGADRTKGKGCKTSTEGKGRTCNDGLDNDGNGLIDCDDPGCAKNKSCR
jgi:hypothetical protein